MPLLYLFSSSPPFSQLIPLPITGLNLTQLLNIMDKTGEETWVGRAFACLNAVSDDGGGSYESWTPWDRARDLAKEEKPSVRL